MPRPKKAGAPEPKKRSRTGCWPCKKRKVKCDERRPKCLNCEKQGEECDFSIKLNWDGRGKRTEDAAGTGTINFSASQISFGPPSRPSTADSSSAQTPHRTDYTASPPPGSVPFFTADSTSPHNYETFSNPLSTQILQATNVEKSESDMTLIDPSLMRHNVQIPSMLEDGMFGGILPQVDHQYTQSYERYHSSTPGTPLSGPPTSNSFFYEGQDESGTYTERSSKRKRLQPIQDQQQSYDASMQPPSNTSFPSILNASFPASPSSNLLPSVTPSADNNYLQRHHPVNLSLRRAQESADLRRLSVNSLLSSPISAPYHGTTGIGDHEYPIQIEDIYQDTIPLGIDRGFKDLDIGRNDDTNAISGSSPIAMREHIELILDEDGQLQPVEFGFGTSEVATDKGGYYDHPVSISIPRILEPLPDKLLENPMNLLYFHHFINHTAGCLIPHNCSSNPFKSILPQMAVRDDNLLSLLLAYSASHRARLLRQPEPATRIAMWVVDIFPNLRKALDDPSEIISDSNLATAIMLASLEIISPKAFGVAVPWQKHLDMARQMIAAGGGPQRIRTASREDKVSSFLWSWFAYLDVLGSLSGGKGNSPSSAWILDYDIDNDNDYQIDCILGFTSKCIRVLAKIAELSRVCDGERIGPDRQIRPDWKPSAETIARADKLMADLAESRLHPSKPCTHMEASGEAAYQWDSMQMTATNDCFHLAGLIHLHRRILGKPSTHPDVQGAVREIFGALYKVQRGSSAEACLLFPMFTAGCDTQDEKQRDDILDRIIGVERLGMTQVHNARTLMERAWETGKPWETLVAGEFFG